jgi:hypothetical protein
MVVADVVPVSDGDRMAAKGAPITLDDGSEVRIRFDMEALKELEKKFGDLTKIIEELQRDGWADGRIETITYLLKTTMLHLEWENGEHKYPGKAERLSHLLDSSRLLDSTYLTALNVAMAEALPTPSEEDIAAAKAAAEQADPLAEGRKADSPGNGSTPMPPAVTVDAIGSSGV